MSLKIGEGLRTNIETKRGMRKRDDRKRGGQERLT